MKPDKSVIAVIASLFLTTGTLSILLIQRDAEILRLKTAMIKSANEINHITADFLSRPSAPIGLKARVKQSVQYGSITNYPSLFSAQMHDNANRMEDIRREAVADLGREYSGILESMGVPRERIAEFVERMAVIKAGHIETEEAIVRLKQQKDIFAEELKEAAGEEGLAELSRYANYRRAKEELLQMGLKLPAFAKNGVWALPSGEVETIHKAIEAQGGPYIQSLNFGPFDPVANPQVGQRENTEYLRKQITELTMGSERLLAVLQDKVSPATLETLQTYYREHIADLQKRLELHLLPPAQFKNAIAEMAKRKMAEQEKEQP